jgi:hypothetical protein
VFALFFVACLVVATEPQASDPPTGATTQLPRLPTLPKLPSPFGGVPQPDHFRELPPKSSNVPGGSPEFRLQDARTIQIESRQQPNPFLGSRPGDLPTIRDSLPATTKPVARVPDIVGHGIELVEKFSMGPRIARDLSAAVEVESAQLPAGRFENRNVWTYDFKSGFPISGSTVILTNPDQESSLLPPGYRRPELSPTVTVGRSPFPSLLSTDRFVLDRYAIDVATLRDMAVQQTEYDREKLAFDRIRSLWTPAGPDAVTSVRDYVPQAVPAMTRAPNRGVQVYSEPIGPMPKPSTFQSPRGWHPPMLLPDSTPLP